MESGGGLGGSGGFQGGAGGEKETLCWGEVVILLLLGCGSKGRGKNLPVTKHNQIIRHLLSDQS